MVRNGRQPTGYRIGFQARILNQESTAGRFKIVKIRFIICILYVAKMSGIYGGSG